MNNEKKVKDIINDKYTSKMYDGPYDKVIKGFAGTNFDAYYTRGEHVKLTDGAMVVDIFKPGKCNTADAYYKDAIIKITEGDRKDMTYADFLRLNGVIELAINLLNKERFNKINRYEEKEYATTHGHRAVVKKKYRALDEKEIEVGGIYLDAKKNPWVYLGKDVELNYVDGPMLREGEGSFRIGYDDGHYAYMPVTETFRQLSGNVLMGGSPIYVLAKKKSFYGKLGAIDLDGKEPIYIDCGNDIYEVKPTSREQSIEQI